MIPLNSSIDMHVHSNLSPCASQTLKMIEHVALERGLNGVCITDHDLIQTNFLTISRCKTDTGLFIFPGVEITAKDCHILSYGLDTLPLIRDTPSIIDEIHQQGGLAIFAHPYRPFISYESVCNEIDLEELFHLSWDAIEICNGGNKPEWNKEAKSMAEICGFSGIGGSDAHFPDAIGRCVTKFPTDICSFDEFIDCLQKKVFFLQRKF